MTDNVETPINSEGNVSVRDATALLAGLEAEADGGEGEQEIQDGEEGGAAEAELAAELEAGAAENNDDDDVEAAGDDDTEDALDDDQGDQDDDSDDPWIELKLDGEMQEIRLSELTKGYQRMADYTKKTQEVAQQRRQVEQGMQNLQQQAVSYADAYLQMSNQIEALAPTEDAIKDAWGFDPKGAAELKDRREQLLAFAQQSKGLAVALHQQRQQVLKQQMAQAGQELPNHIPEWADLDVRKKELTGIAQHLVERGLSPQDIEQTANPVAWAIARDAWLYRQLQERAAGKGRKQPAPKVRKSRAPKPRLQGKNRKARNAKQSFDKTGSRADAIALMAQFEE